MMHGHEKSDGCVVPEISPNNAGLAWPRRGGREGTWARGTPSGSTRPGHCAGPACQTPHTVAPRYWMGCHNPEPHDVITQAKSPVREFRTPGSARGCAVMRIPTATRMPKRADSGFLCSLLASLVLDPNAPVSRSLSAPLDG